MHRVDILVHAFDSFGPQYYMHVIGSCWLEAGIEVNVAVGPDHPANADAVVLHTDITKVPVEYLAKARAYPVAINGHVADISKRIVSRNVVRRPSDYDGPVIVKTDRNCFGDQEAAFAEVLGQSDGPRLARPEYRVYPSTQEVPPEIWADTGLMVDRFLPEYREGMYWVRAWTFFGNQDVHSRACSEEQIVKPNTFLKREFVEGVDVPEELRQLREELAFDFGRFDYAISDGQVVLYDANRTPVLANYPNDNFLPQMRFLSQGLGCFLPGYAQRAGPTLQ